MVTKFGCQMLATKFGFVPDCLKLHVLPHLPGDQELTYAPAVVTQQPF